MSEHTPGPWEIGYRGIRPTRPIEGYTIGYAPICIVRGDKRLHGNGVREANARVIAAAPELLEALKEIQNNAKNHPMYMGDDAPDDAQFEGGDAAFVTFDIERIASAAIAKAEGKQ